MHTHAQCSFRVNENHFALAATSVMATQQISTELCVVDTHSETQRTDPMEAGMSRKGCGKVEFCPSCTRHTLRATFLLPSSTFPTSWLRVSPSVICLLSMPPPKSASSEDDPVVTFTTLCSQGEAADQNESQVQMVTSRTLRFCRAWIPVMNPLASLVCSMCGESRELGDVQHNVPQFSVRGQ